MGREVEGKVEGVRGIIRPIVLAIDSVEVGDATRHCTAALAGGGKPAKRPRRFAMGSGSCWDPLVTILSLDMYAHHIMPIMTCKPGPKSSSILKHQDYLKGHGTYVLRLQLG